MHQILAGRFFAQPRGWESGGERARAKVVRATLAVVASVDGQAWRRPNGRRSIYLSAAYAPQVYAVEVRPPEIFLMICARRTTDRSERFTKEVKS